MARYPSILPCLMLLSCMPLADGLETLPADEVCWFATIRDVDELRWDRDFPEHIREARRRGLRPDDCPTY